MSMLQIVPAPQVSERKLEANRANAKKSTGPKTEDGKKTVSLSAYKHGLCSEALVLPDEDRAAFERMRTAWFNDFQPRTEVRAEIVDRLVANCWKMKRCLGSQNEHVSAAMTKEGLAFDNQLKAFMDKGIRLALSDEPEKGFSLMKKNHSGIAWIIDSLALFQRFLTVDEEWTVRCHLQLLVALCPPPLFENETWDDDEDAESLSISSLRLLTWDKLITGAEFSPIADEAEAKQVRERMRDMIEVHRDRWRDVLATLPTPEESRRLRVNAVKHQPSEQVQLLQRYESQLDRSFRGNLRDLNQLIKTGVDLVETPCDEKAIDTVEQAPELAVAVAEAEPAQERNKATEPVLNKAVTGGETLPEENKATESSDAEPSNSVIMGEEAPRHPLRQ